KMSEQEKNRILEENLPSTEAIIAEYKKQGRELTESEAGQIRNRIKEDSLDTVVGGVGGSAIPTRSPLASSISEELTYSHR
nr:hypothetical protein [Lachnospiraceae bacterium]